MYSPCRMLRIRQADNSAFGGNAGNIMHPDMAESSPAVIDGHTADNAMPAEMAVSSRASPPLNELKEPNLVVTTGRGKTT